MKTRLQTAGVFFIVATMILSVVVLFNVPIIEQNSEYHKFSDSKTILNISNFWNVISNISFLVVGLIGLFKLNLFKNNRIQYLMLFLGISFISFGSGYYHLSPNNETLVWDRIPMVVAFMALFSILISEFINDKIGKKALLPLLFSGLGSVIYWILKDDLRPYVLIQFYPIVVMPIILICFNTKCTISKGYWFLLAAYLLAKLLEYFDSQMYHYISFSGHSLKHIISSIGLFYFLKISAFNYGEQ